MRLIDDILQGLPANSVPREKVSQLSEQNEAAKQEIARLKDDLRERDAKVLFLEEHIEALTREDALDDLELKIMDSIGKLDYPHAVAAVIKENFLPELSLTRIEYHLDRLDQLDYVRSGVVDQMGAHYGLTQKARKLLLDKNLL